MDDEQVDDENVLVQHDIWVVDNEEVYVGDSMIQDAKQLQDNSLVELWGYVVLNVVWGTLGVVLDYNENNKERHV